MPQLDALRFFAVVAVVVAHNWQPAPLPWIFERLHFGGLGVRLFFVLSGFLITGILLRAARATETRRQRLHAMRQFYARRFLRIFPLYYLVLILCLIFAVEPARELWGWLFTYMTNVYTWREAEFIPNLGHFWTLAVEEQFYLAWPLVVLLQPRRRLLPVLAALISSALAYRYFASYRYPVDIATGQSATGTLIFGVIDCLALGGLLALCTDINADRLQTWIRRFLTGLALPLGLACSLAAMALAHYFPGSHIAFTFGPLGEGLVCCWLIGHVSHGLRGASGRLLEYPPLVYLGKITYGIYVFHLLVPVVFEAIAGAAGLTYENKGFLNFVASGAVTIAVASLSWHVFESPLNQLKRHFPMPRPVATIRAQAGGSAEGRAA